ncbi:MAG: glycosyl transferase family 28 [Bacteroidetes bacterium]|jgi:uncharacterized protein (TIGR00661 family)|nr:glycosyl transferase family 28 [Bacteroidota bacterium]
MKQPQRILICPLDWGLGHATRCIPVINAFLSKKAEVIIAADGRPYELLKKEFPQLTFVRLKGYDISYSVGNMTLQMILSIPKILKGIKDENKALQKIIDEFKIDVVVSDNRYGCWGKTTRNIFITHQLMIKSPFGENILNRIVLSYIRKFNECWIPDHDGDENLTGDLSHKYALPERTYFIGPLSRFNKGTIKSEPAFELMAIISGPEPQRSIFEKLILDQLKHSGLKSFLVKGIPQENGTVIENGNVKIASHLAAEEMSKTIINSEIIISRSGYSTIMDLAVLEKKAIFIPTPGQTEQEYLATYFSKKKIAFYEKQSEFDLMKSLKESENYNGFKSLPESNQLLKRIGIILSSE